MFWNHFKLYYLAAGVHDADIRLVVIVQVGVQHDERLRDVLL